MISMYMYCYLFDPLNIGTSKWAVAPLAFICIFFFFKYLYSKSKEAKGYALLTTILLFILMYICINIIS